MHKRTAVENEGAKRSRVSTEQGCDYIRLQGAGVKDNKLFSLS